MLAVLDGKVNVGQHVLQGRRVVHTAGQKFDHVVLVDLAQPDAHPALHAHAHGLVALEQPADP